MTSFYDVKQIQAALMIHVSDRCLGQIWSQCRQHINDCETKCQHVLCYLLLTSKRIKFVNVFWEEEGRRGKRDWSLPVCEAKLIRP